jgi:hypothetical protein
VITIAKTIPTAETLTAAFLAEGRRPGLPDHLDARTAAIDRRTCRRLRCPACHRRGLACQPWTDGRRYRVLAPCACGAAEEM